jgi:hypothetical protein
MSIRFLAAAAVATAIAGFAGAAQANPAHHYGYEAAPRYEVIPETTGVYFKRNFVGRQLVVQQCYKRRAWTSTGDLFWSEVCN